jgi:hypothetical protein
MGTLVAITICDSIVTGPLKDFFQRLIAFLPNLISSLIIFFLGLLLGWIFKKIIVKIATLLNTDRFCSTIGITEACAKVGIKGQPSYLLGRIFYWLVVVVVTIIALYTLKVPSIENLLERFLLYLPNIFIAVLLIIVGYLLGNFLGRATLIASVNAGIQFAAFLAKGVKALVFVFAFAMALEQLGIGRNMVIVAFTILFSGIVLALALAFGLGGKDMAKDYLEKRFKSPKKEEKKDDIQHL